MTPREKPCPFCGDALVEIRRYPDEDRTEYVVRCVNCDAKGPTAHTRQGAEDAWNERHVPPRATPPHVIHKDADGKPLYHVPGCPGCAAEDFPRYD